MKSPVPPRYEFANCCSTATSTEAIAAPVSEPSPPITVTMNAKISSVEPRWAETKVV